jgi:hypothetical protein
MCENACYARNLCCFLHADAPLWYVATTTSSGLLQDVYKTVALPVMEHATLYTVQIRKYVKRESDSWAAVFFA